MTKNKHFMINNFLKTDSSAESWVKTFLKKQSMMKLKALRQNHQVNP